MESQPLSFFGHAAFIFCKVFLKYIAVILELLKFDTLRQKVQVPRAIFLGWIWTWSSVNKPRAHLYYSFSSVVLHQTVNNCEVSLVLYAVPVSVFYMVSIFRSFVGIHADILQILVFCASCSRDFLW